MMQSSHGALASRVFTFLLLVGLVLVSSACTGRATDPDAGLADAPTAVPDAAPTRLRFLGIDPPRGSFRGGVRAVLEGSGFADPTTVLIDGTRVDAAQVEVRTSGRIALVMPPHAAGTVDIEVQSISGSAVLEDAFEYTRLAVEPSSAPELGGRRVTLSGAGTDFTSGDRFLFDGTECTELVVTSPIEASCRVPAGSGVVDVEHRRGETVIDLLPASFTYVPALLTEGGAYGEAIAGALDVQVVGAVGPIEDALVWVDDQGTVYQARTNAEGWAQLREAGLAGQVDVHAGHRCYGRTSLVGVDASTLVLPLALIQGERVEGCPAPASGSGRGVGTPPGTIRGHVRFLSADEFPAPTSFWTSVPQPRSGEVRVAYVIPMAELSTDGARLVPADWDDTIGGMPFAVETSAGVQRVCAVAGIESAERPPVLYPAPLDDFRAFAFGCSAPVVVPPHGESRGVVVEIGAAMSTRLDILTRTPAGMPASISAWAGLRFRDATWHGGPRTTPVDWQLQRLPEPASWWDDNDLYVGASVGPTLFEVWVREPVASIELEPLPAIAVVSPIAASTLRLGDSLEFSTASPAELDSVIWTIGGPRVWFLFARGDRRRVTLPDTDDPALALPSGVYAVSLAVAEVDGFDFDAATITRDALVSLPSSATVQVQRSMRVSIEGVLVRP
jgi:hypothetical protein